VLSPEAIMMPVAVVATRPGASVGLAAFVLLLVLPAASAGPAPNTSGHTLSAAPTRQIRRFTATSQFSGVE